MPPKKHPSKLTPAQWREIRKRRTAALKRQTEGFESSEIFKKSVEAKLAAMRPRIEERLESDKTRPAWWENFQRCGEQTMHAVCIMCGRVHDYPYACSLKWCPRCNWRIADRRRRELEATTASMTQTKHVVLTQKNFDSGLLEKALESRKNLKKLCRQKIMGKVRGGCASLEFTNEERGWHMHWHLLVDSPFVDAGALSKKWGELVGQEYAIVKVLKVTRGSYLQEVCKYAVKGSELAKWSGDKIFEFATMSRKIRMFTVWGNFVAARKEAKKFLRETRPPAEPCSCGCGSKIVHHDLDTAKRIAVKQRETGGW